MIAMEKTEMGLFRNSDLCCQIRVVEKNGEPWFVAKDVCDALQYSNSRDALSKHVRDKWKNNVVIRDGTTGNPEKTIINEAGLFALVMKSKMVKAVEFQDWVCEEVLPSIRKTGVYYASGGSPADKVALRRWIKTGEPMGVADFCARLRQMGCTLGPRGLMKWLRERGIMDKWPNAGMPTAKALEEGWAVEANTRILGLDGCFSACKVALITPKGMAHVIAELKRKKLAA